MDRVVVSLAPPSKPAQAAPPPPRQAPPPPQQPPPAARANPPRPIAEPLDVAPEPAQPPPPEPAPEEAAPELEIPIPEQQIVALPDAGKEKPPEDTRFRSDRDNTVEEQTVKKGEPQPSDDIDGDDMRPTAPDAKLAELDPNDAAGANDLQGLSNGADAETGSGASDQAPVKSGQAEADRFHAVPKAENRRLDVASLMPNALALAAEQAKRGGGPEEGSSGGTKARQDRRRSNVAWEPSTTLRGTLDYLPDVQPGNVTLLNTKADLFAPFVRRVMTRVFQNMLILLKRAGPSMRPGMSEQLEAEAIMSPEGRMIGLKITKRPSSLSIGLDRVLQEACSEAFFDRNPPPGAIGDDGNIHFVMQTIVQTYPSTGRRNVGLSAYFGVGLL